MPPLPPAAIAALAQPHLQVNIGDVWWIPERHVRYPGNKDRFCLIVGFEYSPGSAVPARAHFVAGTTKRTRKPVITLQAGEAHLNEVTNFGFWWSGDIDLERLVAEGKYRGQLTAVRIVEISSALSASRRPVLQRLAQ